MLKAKPRYETKRHFSPLTVILLIGLILYVISLVYPLVWSLLTSFKSPAEYRINITGLPEEWIWNYSFVFEKFTVRVWTGKTMLNVGVWQMLLNSLLYSVGSAVCAAFIPCIAAYACAKFKYKTSKIFFNIVVVTMVLPVVGNLPSEIQMARWFGLFDQVWGLWIMKCSALGMYFLIFHAVFKSLPDDFTEAAKVDGAGNFRIFFRIVLPVVRNTLTTVILIKFIEFWNDYQTPLVYLPTHPVMAYGMYQMQNTTTNGMNSVPMRMTGAMIMLIPIMIIFLLLQKRLLGNLMVGGIKG